MDNERALIASMASVGLIAMLALPACSDDTQAPGQADASAVDGPTEPDAAPPDAGAPDADPGMPAVLSATGLYADIATETLAPGVRHYQPQWQLWSDSATKNRWVWLPEGTQIDTSDMDYWQYPVGTKLWKEFTRDDVRIETRLLQKNDPDTWFMVSYVWNDEQTEAVAAPDGLTDAKGTAHDVPNSIDCQKCHRNMPDKVIGFSAVMLDHQQTDTSLDDLVTDGLLSDPPAGNAPYFPLPGTPTAQAALGYFHANCSNCHNPTSDVMDNVQVDFRLRTGQLGGDITGTATYTSTVGVTPMRNAGAGVTAIIEPGDPDASAVHVRMNDRMDIDLRMPPLGTELVDTMGLQIVDDWINDL